MIRPILLMAILALACAGQAAAANLTVQVQSSDGRPAANAVVTVRGAGIGGPVRIPGPLMVAQEHLQFHPYVLIAPVGAEVVFPNKDTVRHHVYSFSTTKKFELKLYGREEARTIRFDKPGVVALGCNIHDQMVAYIYVSDTSYAALTNGSGVAILRGVPAGNVRLSVWHPDAKAKGGEITQAMAIGAGDMSRAVTLDLRGARR